MTYEEELEWGRAEAKARMADLDDVKSAEALKAAQGNAERRRKAVGLSRSRAASLVIEATRELRRRRPEDDEAHEALDQDAP